MTISKEGFDAWRSGKRPLTHSRKEWTVGRWFFKYERRRKDNAMGRFGGGWQWELGFKAGKGSIILNLLIASFRIDRMNICYRCDKPLRFGPYKRYDGDWHWFHSDCWEAVANG